LCAETSACGDSAASAEQGSTTPDAGDPAQGHADAGDPAQGHADAGDPAQGHADAGEPPADAGHNSTDAGEPPRNDGGADEPDAAEDAGPPRITASRVDATVTLESFSAECDALHGLVEIHPHCGGANTCRGMSYDQDTHVYTEHTCKGLNTCRGFSCVLPD
jgi:hypothetical protein